MDNIQLYYIDNEINKIDKMKQGDVIYKNGVEPLAVLSYDHNEPCKGCFFYEDKARGSERLIKCWDRKKEYIFTAIRKYNTTELRGIVKRYEETILKTIESYERQDRSGLLARMLLESPIWFNPVVKLTWKRKVIKMKKITRKRYLSKNISSIPSATILNVKDIPSNRSLFQLAVSERHVNGIGYGSLLPTAQTQGLKVCDKDGKTRFMDLSSLPKQGIEYGDLLPTPVASDHTGPCTIRKMTKSNGAPRTDSLRNMPAVIGMDGDRLNGRVFQPSPLFVEEMMGYPLTWTTLPFLTGNGEKSQ